MAKRPPTLPAEQCARPEKGGATLDDWLSNKYTITPWHPSVFDRSDVIPVVILYSGIGGFTKAFNQDKQDGMYLIPAVAVERDTEVAATHRTNHPNVPMINMNMVNHRGTLAAIGQILPQTHWGHAWRHASASCKEGSSLNQTITPLQMRRWRAMGEWAALEAMFIR